eukprot:CFRG0396T1
MSTPSEVPVVNSAEKEIVEKIVAQGSIVADLKKNSCAGIEIASQVELLLSLKTEYETVTGKPYEGGGRARKPKTPKAKIEKKPVADVKGKTKLGLANKKSENYQEWYSEVIKKAELIEHHDVSGCYVLRPNSFHVWEMITEFLNRRIRVLGVQNTSFPLFVSQRVLMKEKDHIEGFAPEVAWVTKAGNSELAEPCAIRPTSETVVYPYFAKWIRSHRDLPLKVNQWCNVVRWEFKNPQPFLRTREFLWQEGHTAHATKEEADQEVLTILDFYRQTYEDLLAVSVTPGIKSEKEKFAGALYTSTVEAYIPGSGRAIQGATSHCLGQNFSRMFDITYEVETEGAAKKEFVWQNSWGLSTRSIGVCIMVHGDDKGLVMPPRVALHQVVVIPCGITAKTTGEERVFIEGEATKLASELNIAGLRATADVRDNYTPGWKYSHWEQKGVPVRLEVGPKDLEKRTVLAVRRDTGEKISLPLDTITISLSQLMDTIHNDLFAKSKKQTEDHKPLIESWDEFVPSIDAGNLCQIPWCEETECEESIKKDSARSLDVDEKAPSMGAKSLCIPLVQPADASGKNCIKCGKPAKSYTLFGRSY